MRNPLVRLRANRTVDALTTLGGIAWFAVSVVWALTWAFRTPAALNELWQLGATAFATFFIAGALRGGFWQTSIRHEGDWLRLAGELRRDAVRCKRVAFLLIVLFLAASLADRASLWRMWAVAGGAVFSGYAFVFAGFFCGGAAGAWFRSCTRLAAH